jgi:hypothetical protein
MNERVEGNAESEISNRGTNSPNGIKAELQHWPTRTERLGLIRSYQSGALRYADPHVANLELMDGDVMLMVLRIRESMEKQLVEDAAPAEGRRFARYADLYLRLTRQIERNARLILQLSRPKGEPDSC